MVLSALLKIFGGAVLGVRAQPLGYIVGWGTLLLLGLRSALPVGLSLGASQAEDRHLLVFQRNQTIRRPQALFKLAMKDADKLARHIAMAIATP